MKGLKIIPMSLMLVLLIYAGVWFVNSNPAEVIIHIGTYETQPTAVGFILLTSILIGITICGLFCSVEMLSLYIQNKRLKRRLSQQLKSTVQSDNRTEPRQEDIAIKTSGRFS